MVHKNIPNASFRSSDTFLDLFGLLHALGAHAYTQAHINTQKSILKRQGEGLGVHLHWWCCSRTCRPGFDAQHCPRVVEQVFHFSNQEVGAGGSEIQGYLQYTVHFRPAWATRDNLKMQEQEGSLVAKRLPYRQP